MEEDIKQQYEMYSDLWRLHKKHYNVNPIKWDEVISDTDCFLKKYNTSLAKDFINAIMDELNRKEKEWRDQ